MTITWSKSTETYTNRDNSFWPLVMFGNSAGGVYGYAMDHASGIIQQPFSFNKFYTYDMKIFGVTADANYVDIGGIEIITGAADFTIAFRALGSTQIIDPTYYQQQLVEAFPLGGQRVTSYDTIPLVNGCFEAAVKAANYPDNGGVPGIGSVNAVGWNLKLKKWGR